MPYQTAHERIVGDIVADIRAGRLHAGDRLPSIRELAERYHVSEMPVRTALRSLRDRRLTYARSGVATFIADDALERLLRDPDWP